MNEIIIDLDSEIWDESIDLGISVMTSEDEEFDFTGGQVFVFKQRRYWPLSGVRSCSKPERHQSAARSALDKYTGEVLNSNRDMRYMSSGWTNGKASWKNYKDPITGKRWCRGSVWIDAFVRMWKE